MSQTLIALRKRQGLSQAEIAERAGLTQPTVSRIERGLSLNAVGLRRLLDALGATDRQRSAALAEVGTTKPCQVSPPPIVVQGAA